MTIALIVGTAGGSGCLVTDPVLPLEEPGNSNPEFFQVIPANDATLFVANTSAPVTFSASARDEETPRGQLVYEWTVDNGPVVLGPGADLRQYTTSGAALGAGLHLVRVLVTDDGLPTGFAQVQWQVQVQ